MMIKKFRWTNLLLVLSLFFVLPLQAKEYKYKTVPNDPLKVREYVLDNGLKVFLTVNQEKPRIQTYIAVRAGSKHDPLETTGLAHYFEHMMFKGTSNFGTLDFEKEKPLLEAIVAQYEVYNKLTDSLERKEAYRVIDSLSYEASKYAIPNEYDKLMSAIGAEGTNAGTSYDYTVYIEDIPANQVETWAKIQADRFQNMILRLFHTEIETVYEEKNMSLTKDNRKALELILETLFPNHPYGQHNVLGLQEHLKNPSLKNIRNFFETYYVPNNMAIIMAGDFDPDQTIAVIDKYFGTLKAKEFPKFTFEQEKAITEPIVKEMSGLEAEMLFLAYPIAGAGTKEAMLAEMTAAMLYNGKTGLIDVNINQAQRMMFSYAGAFTLVDHGVFELLGMPGMGQSLDEVRALLLEQLDLLRKGQFEEWVLQATIDNLRYEQMKELETNSGRGSYIMENYLNGMEWKDKVGYLDELSKITKEDIVKFVNEKFNDNYVVVYKRQGEPEPTVKMPKPEITPIVVNRDVESDFLANIKQEVVAADPIHPLFLDYSKDIVKGNLGKKKDIDVLYSKNEENETFSLALLLDMGQYSDKLWSMVSNYYEYLGTSKLSAAAIQAEFYKIACNFRIVVNSERIYVVVSGLSDNMEKALELTESILDDCQPNAEALEKMKQDIKKSRLDNKANQSANVQALLAYGIYGENSPRRFILSNEELDNVTAEQLVEKIRSLKSYKHSFLYYGPKELDEVTALLAKKHKTPKKLQDLPETVKFVPLATDENRVLFVHYDANQSYCYTASRGVKYSPDMLSKTDMYNNYFGGGMNSIVFQELREKRSLAYASGSFYNQPQDPDGYYTNLGYIITQNDKVIGAFHALDELFNQMPVSQYGFALAKESILSQIRTERISKMDKLFQYLDDKKWGFNEDSRKLIFETIPSMTLEDVVKFNQDYIKNKAKTYMILGNEADFDFDQIEKELGKVTKLTQEDIFGY